MKSSSPPASHCVSKGGGSSSSPSGPASRGLPDQYRPPGGGFGPRARTATKVLVIIVLHRIHATTVTFIASTSSRTPCCSSLCPEAHVLFRTLQVADPNITSPHPQLGDVKDRVSTLRGSVNRAGGSTYSHLRFEEESKQILAVEVEVVWQGIVLLAADCSGLARTLARGGCDRRLWVRSGKELLCREGRGIRKVNRKRDFLLPFLLDGRRIVCTTQRSQ